MHTITFAKKNFNVLPGAFQWVGGTPCTPPTPPGFETTTDLSDFFDIDEFALTVTLSDSSTIKAVFDDSFQIEGLTTGEVVTTNPQILCQTSDVFCTIVVGDEVTLSTNNVTYKVIEIHPNIDATTTLMLSRDS